MSLVAYDSSSDEEEEESKPMKKRKESVKITIPSLKEFEDEEEETSIAKKPKLQSGSGLFSLLPPPKHASSSEKSGFVPHILLSKREKPVTPLTQNKNNTIPVTTSLKSTSPPTSTLAASEEHESDDENVSVKGSSNNTSYDFFWLDDLASKSETKVEDILSTPIKDTTFLQHLSSQLPCSSTSSIHESHLSKIKEDMYLKQHQISAVDVSQVEETTDCNSFQQQLQPVDDSYVNNSSNDSRESLIKDKEFRKLQGHKREFENIDIIDVNADDQLTDRNEWLMKSVTEEMTYRPKKKHGLPTQQQKRKHQITYLAFQAKEREMDLKNQWALNRLTRRETQSKYGF